MKVMWIMATPMGYCASAFGNTVLGSGGWIDACLDKIREYKNNEIDLHIVALSNCNKESKSEANGVTYYLVNCPQIRGKVNRDTDLSDLKKLIEKIRPDVIQIWGTEYSIGYDTMRITSIPVVFYIQGVMSSLVTHKNGDLSNIEFISCHDVFLLPKLVKTMIENLRIKRQSKIERTMISNCAGIIIDNDWASNQYQYSKASKYKIPLPINTVFSSNNWTIDVCKKHSIFTIAGRTPLKGLHILIDAISIVRNKYPDVELLIPGNIDNKKPDFLYAPIYLEYLRKKIDKLDLNKNVRFLGKLSQKQMANRMKEAHVFVMPSCVENHSSTLREAMSVGCPCVSSTVGSVCEYVNYGYNGLLYRYDDYVMLAGNIIKLFENNELAVRIGKNAKRSIEESYPQYIIGESLIEVYRDVISPKKVSVNILENELRKMFRG